MAKKKYIDKEYGIERKSHPDEPLVKENAKEREYWRLLEIIPTTGDYSAEQRMEAIVHYMVYGNVRKASKATGINESTIAYWKNKSKWWSPALRELRKQKDDEVDAKLTGMIDRTLNEMDERLQKGDEKIVKGEHGFETRRQKVSFRDLGVGLGISYDKRALQRGDPTQRVEKVSDSDRLKKLSQEFKRIAQERTIDGTAIVVPNNDEE